MEELIKSFDYSALDHKWLSRRNLMSNNWSLERLLNTNPDGLNLDLTYEDLTSNSNSNSNSNFNSNFNSNSNSFVKLNPQQEEQGRKPTPLETIMLKIALSSFRYYYVHYENIINDQSLATVTSMCSSTLNTLNINSDDKQVFYLSHVFNRIVDSSRKLLKCYDCGTNARAVFLKLVQVGRQTPTLMLRAGEKQRMRTEYVVDKETPLIQVNNCLKRLLINDSLNLVLIMSISVENFGHVWVFEKKYFNGIPRYHHYQSALSSHMLIDFIESMDYGADPMKSLDVTHFFDQLTTLINVTGPWSEKEYRLFVKLFAFIPISKILNPQMGFSWTWLSY
jgi:hypothetical protein